MRESLGKRLYTCWQENHDKLWGNYLSFNILLHLNFHQKKLLFQATNVIFWSLVSQITDKLSKTLFATGKVNLFFISRQWKLLNFRWGMGTSNMKCYFVPISHVPNFGMRKTGAGLIFILSFFLGPHSFYFLLTLVFFVLFKKLAVVYYQAWKLI